jgi:hypothetical protein
VTTTVLTPVKADLPLLAREIVTTLSAVHIGAQLLLAVGTASFDRREDFEDWVLDGSNRVDAPQGRVLLIDPSRGEVDVVATKNTVGPVHDVAGIGGLLAIAAASKVSEAGMRLIAGIDQSPPRRSTCRDWLILVHIHCAASPSRPADTRQQ